jgi:tetratricopeptide (TPR) repeat protein
MRTTPRVIAVAIVGLIVLAVPALADVDEDVAAARTCLQKADFDGAIKAYESAAQSAGKDSEYALEARLIHRVVGLRGRLEQTKDTETWLKLAQALRTFYVDRQVYSEALPIDRRIHELKPSQETTAELARTLLRLDRPQDAQQALETVAIAERTLPLTVLVAIAQARQGDLALARIAADEPVQGELTPAQWLDRAQLLALVDHQDEALAALKQSLEATHPARITFVRTSLAACPDFKSVDADALKQTLATESTIKVSSCSSGSSCGNCPSRSSCSGSSKSDDAKQDDCSGKK